MAEDDIFDVETFTKNVISGLDTPKELFIDLPLGAVQAGYNVAKGDSPFKDSIPNVPGPFAEAEEFLLGLENSAGAGSFEEIAGTLTGSVASGYGTIKVLDQIKEKSPSLFKKLRKAYPFSVGQFYVAMKALPDGPGKINKFLNMMKGTLPQGFNIFKDKGKSTVLKKVLPNLLKLGTAGGALSMVFDAKGLNEGEDEYMALVNQLYKDGLIEKDEDGNIVRTEKAILLQQQEENAKNEEARKIIEENTANYAIGGDVELSDITTEQPGYISEEKLESMFADADLKPTQGEQMPEVEMAGLFGKAPIWGVAAVDKAKMLLQQFTKNEKRNMDNVTSKLGTEADVNTTIDDIVDVDITAEGTAVGVPKSKKTIIDSPETAESVFYSGLEARLMDPNTPESFDTVQKFYDFINKKGVGKAEIEDNALLDYIRVAEKNNLNINKADVLKIIRDAPLRKIDNVTYGDARYGGTNRAKYDGYQEKGALPGTYREDVMYLPAKDIPLDPDSLPPGGAAHDFGEKYVIGWSRLTDRKAKLPVDKTAQGIEEAVDPAMIRTLKRNQTKLKNQLKGLEASAYEKIRRAYDLDVTPLDEMNPRMVTESVDSRMSFLEDIDMPLANQIRQFRSKIQDDSVKLKGMEATTKGQQVTVTFADEVQSDILQQAKRMEENFLEKLADLMDKNKDVRANTIAAGQRGYRDEYRGLNPEVAEFFIENKSVFRPVFQTAQDMQQFLDEFTKTQKAISALGDAGLRPDPMIVRTAQAARKKQAELLSELKTSLSKESMQMLMPNVPFKNRSEWGSALIKMNVNNAAKRLFIDKADDAAEWFAISPSKLITKRYGQSGGTNVPPAERTKDMKGIGMEEFYGGPSSTDYKGKHYTSVLEKEMKRLARENNSEFKVIKIDNVGDAFAVKLTPEMLLPHKTHRKKGGMVYTPEIIDIFEAA